MKLFLWIGKSIPGIEPELASPLVRRTAFPCGSVRISLTLLMIALDSSSDGTDSLKTTISPILTLLEVTFFILRSHIDSQKWDMLSEATYHISPELLEAYRSLKR
jgi:hypothetical protein